MAVNRSTVVIPAQVRTGSLAAWLVAVRPYSMRVAFSPVLVGAKLGFARHGALDLVAALLVLGAASLVQGVTNMHNDVGYTVRGGESSGTRTGLPQATANGWLSVALQSRRDFRACAPGMAFNDILFRTFRPELWFAALLSAAALLGRVLS